MRGATGSPGARRRCGAISTIPPCCSGACESVASQAASSSCTAEHRRSARRRCRSGPARPWPGRTGNGWNSPTSASSPRRRARDWSLAARPRDRCGMVGGGGRPVAAHLHARPPGRAAELPRARLHAGGGGGVRAGRVKGGSRLSALGSRLSADQRSAHCAVRFAERQRRAADYTDAGADESLGTEWGTEWGRSGDGVKLQRFAPTRGPLRTARESPPAQPFQPPPRPALAASRPPPGAIRVLPRRSAARRCHSQEAGAEPLPRVGRPDQPPGAIRSSSAKISGKLFARAAPRTAQRAARPSQPPPPPLALGRTRAAARTALAARATGSLASRRATTTIVAARSIAAMPRGTTLSPMPMAA